MTEEELSIERELVTALQLLLSSFTLLHKPSRISVRTARFGWQTGVVDDGTEGAIQFQLRWVAGWLDRALKGDQSVSMTKAKRRIDDVLLRLEERSSG